MHLNLIIDQDVQRNCKCPPLTDPDRLKAFKDALRNWEFTGYITFQLTEQAGRWIRQTFGNITLKEISRLMHEYVAAGGEIDEVVEQRTQWRDLYEYHHDLRFEIQGVRVYIETRLIYRLPINIDDTSIIVVNIHEQ
jgi:hypothetical protein